MLTNPFVHRLLHMNTFLWICVIFTVATFMDTVLTLAISGDFYGTDYRHLVTRFVLCVFISVSLLVFRYFEKLPFFVIIGLHFLAVLVFTVLYVWISGFFMEQHPRAMFYMVRSILIIYPIIGVSLIATDIIYKKIKRT